MGRLVFTSVSWTGGTISVSADRSTLQCAPESVRLSVDLSDSTFDTTAGSDPYYDARLHDLEYFWDFGDTGNWSSPTNIPSAWKAKTNGKGPWVSHVYSTPGSYTVTLTIRERSSGKISTTTHGPITVLNPDDVYSGTDTICVSSSGTFAGAPSGAATVTASSLYTTDTAWTDRDGGNAKRWLFRAGETFTVGLDIDNTDTAGMCFGAFGAGAKPIINAPVDDTNSNRVFYVRGSHDGLGGADTPDFRCSGLDFRGNFDPTDTIASTANTATTARNVWRFEKYLDTVIHDCAISGFCRSAMSGYPQSATNRPAHTHMDDVTMTDFGGQYACIWAGKLDATVSVTGCRFAQNTLAANDDSVRAIIRVNHMLYTHMRGCDFFATDGSQPAVKPQFTPEVEGCIVNIHNTSIEGGRIQLSFGGNASQGIGYSVRTNVILENVIAVGTYATRQNFDMTCSGVTIRGCQTYLPDSPYTSAYQEAVAFGESGTVQTGYLALPNQVYSNTFSFERGQSSNNNVAPLTVDAGTMTNVTEVNNVAKGEFSGQTGAPNPSAPLSTTSLFTPRTAGDVDASTFTLDTQYALVAADVPALVPATGSNAIGTATTGAYSLVDFDLVRRETTVDGLTRTDVSKGPYEPNLES